MATAFTDPVMPFPGFDRATQDNILVNPEATADESVHAVYTRLRNEDPVHWCEPTGYRPFWAVTRHADITTVSKANSRFINSKRTYLAPAEAEKWTLDTVGDTHLFRSLVDLDDPLHMKLRRLTHDWFLPANLRKLEPMISAVAKDHVDRMAAMGGACDFVNEVALFYPLRVIMRILGVPETDEPMMLRMTQEMFGAQDPDVVARSKLITTGIGALSGSSGNPQVDLFALAQEYFAYFGAITADRRANPRDDLSTIIANGTVDGEPIGDREAMSYYVITATAGHDTTSSTTAGGFEQLIRNPDQLRMLQADPSLLPGAVEEMIRWVTPVKHFMRTATEDCALGGKTIREGDGLCLFYWSGNRDERAFAEPFRFKVDRSPNPQTAFGNGVHMCLGLHLARLEIRLLFAELLPRLQSVELAGEPKNSIANFVSGRKTLPHPVRDAMKADPRRHIADNYPWAMEMQTRFADMDVNRHLNNVAITRFFEEARIRFNWNLIANHALSVRPHYLVAHVAVDYLSEGSYPAPLTLTYAVGHIGTSSFRCLMGMFQQGKAIALCDSVLVHRGETGPAPLPAELRTRLEAFPLKG